MMQTVVVRSNNQWTGLDLWNTPEPPCTYMLAVLRVALLDLRRNSSPMRCLWLELNI